jgi:hypothetical protein
MAPEARLRDAVAMQETSAKPDRTLVGILALIAVLVVVALVVVFTRGMPEPLEPGTPERAVQDYTTAVINGDREAASELLTPRWKDECDPMGYGSETADVRITLVKTRADDNSATVTVSIATGLSGGPFGGSGYEYEDDFLLDRDGDGWLIGSAPWELAICPAVKTS